MERKRKVKDSMTIFLKIRREYCNTIIDFLSESSPRYSRLMQPSVVGDLRAHFAVVREMFRDVLMVGSLMSI